MWFIRHGFIFQIEYKIFSEQNGWTRVVILWHDDNDSGLWFFMTWLMIYDLTYDLWLGLWFMIGTVVHIGQYLFHMQIDNFQ